MENRIWILGQQDLEHLVMHVQSQKRQFVQSRQVRDISVEFLPDFLASVFHLGWPSRAMRLEGL